MNWKLIVTLDAGTASALHGDHRPDEIPNAIGEIIFDEDWEIAEGEGDVTVEELSSNQWEVNLPHSSKAVADMLRSQAARYLNNFLEPSQLKVVTDYS